MRAVLYTAVCLTPPVWAQIWPRQTASFSNSSTTSSTVTSSGTTSVVTPPPCCFIYGGFQAVSYNTWYPTTYTDVVATEIVTLHVYNGTTTTANSTTRRANSTFSGFGYYGAANGETVSVPGVRTDLINTNLLVDGEYGGTTVYMATGTEAVTTLGYTFASPTPYAIWYNIGYTTYQPPAYYSNTAGPLPTKWAPTQCGVYSTISYGQYVSGTWTDVPIKVLVPNVDDADQVRDSDYIDMILYEDLPPYMLGGLAAPLSQALPNDGVMVNMPPAPWQSLTNASSILKAMPWFTDCYTIGGVGEPTVHIPVAQVTSTSSHVITMDGAISTSAPTTVTPTSTATSTSIGNAPPSSTTSTADQGTSATSVSSGNSATTSLARNQQNPTTSISSANGGSTQAGGPASSVVQPSSGGQASSGGSSSEEPVGGQQSSNGAGQATGAGSTVAGNTGGGSAGAAPQSTGGAAASNILGVLTQSGNTAAATPASSVQVGIGIGSQTAVPGGSAVTSQGTTYSALASGSGVQVAANGQTTTVTPSTSGSTISLSDGAVLTPISAAVGSSAAVTVNSQTISVQALGTGSVIVGGSTTLSVGGAAATQNGQTISLASGPSGQAIIINGQTAATLAPAVAATASPKTTPAQIVTLGSTVYTAYAAPSASGAVVLAGQTVILGTATIIAGQTLSLSGSALIIASGTITTTQTLTTGQLAPVPTQIITLGTHLATAYAAGSSAIVIQGQTVVAGTAQVIEGETVSLAGTALVVVVSGTQTATEGLGGAIMSGIGGGGSSAGVAPAAYTGGAAGRGVVPAAWAGFVGLVMLMLDI